MSQVCRTLPKNTFLHSQPKLRDMRGSGWLKELALFGRDVPSECVRVCARQGLRTSGTCGYVCQWDGVCVFAPALHPAEEEASTQARHHLLSGFNWLEWHLPLRQNTCVECEVRDDVGRGARVSAYAFSIVDSLVLHSAKATRSALNSQNVNEKRVWLACAAVPLGRDACG